MRRKISLLLLCFVLVFGCTTTVSAKENAAQGDDIKAAEILAAIGVIDDLDLSIYNPEEKITRGEFACRVAKLLKAETAAADGTYYYDLQSHHYAYNSVMALTERGYLSGDGDRMFHPDELIAACDAYSVLINILGYGVQFEAYNNYEAGCRRIAASLKLSAGCSSSEYLTMRDMYIMLRNALTVNLYEVSEISSQDIKYVANEEETILSLYHKAYYNEGTVTGVAAMGLSEDKLYENGEVEIDGVEYESNGDDYTELFGCFVSYIYSEVSPGERKILWISRNEKSSVIEVSVRENECWFDAYSMTLNYYETEGSSPLRKRKISNGAAIIYNGENYEDGGLETIMPTAANNGLNSGNVRIRLVSSSNSSVYDTVVITEYETFSVEVVDKTDKTVYGSNQKAYLMDENLLAYLDIRNDSGSRISLDSIAEDDIVSYARSKSGRVVYALVSHKTVEGTVTSISNDTYPRIKLGDAAYTCGSSEVVSKIKPGSTMKLYLDAFSEVYEASVVKSDTFLAYVIDVVKSSSDEAVMIKALNENGAVEVYQLAPRVSIDDVRYDDYKKAYSVLYGTGDSVHQLVLCKVNAENEISSIETASYEGGLTLTAPSARALYKSNSGKFGAKVIIDANTKIFAVPQVADIAEASDEDFKIKKKTDIINDRNYTVEAYSVDEESEFADAIIILGNDWTRQSVSTSYVLIGELYSTVNDDGMVVDGIEGYSSGEGVRLIASEDYSLSEYQSGDIVRVQKNEKQEITNLDLIYRIGNTYETSGYASTINSSERFVIVHANDKIGGVVKVGYKSGADFDELFNLRNARIMIYDKSAENGKIQLGSYEDIVTYNGTGKTRSSDIAIQTNYGSIVFVVVYND